MLHLINGRIRFIPGLTFNQPPADGGGDATPPADGGATPPADGGATPPADGDDFVAPWERDGSPFDADRAKRLLANKHEAEKKLRERLEAAEARVKEFEDANLTEQQRLEKERDEFRALGETSALEAARLRAGLRYRLSEEDLDFIHGKTEDEVMAAAKRYAELHKTESDPSSPPSRRPSAPRGGIDPSANEPQEMDPRKLAAQIPQQ